MRCRRCRTIYQGRVCPNCSPPFNIPKDQILPEFPPSILDVIDANPVLSRIKPLLILALVVLVGLSIYSGRKLVEKGEYNSEYPPQLISMSDIGMINILHDIKDLHPFKYKGLYYRVNPVYQDSVATASASLSFSSNQFGYTPDSAVIMLYANKEKADVEFDGWKARFKKLSLPVQTYRKLGSHDRYCYTRLHKNADKWSHEILIQKQNMVIHVWGNEDDYDDHSYTQKIIDALADYLSYYK